MRGKRSSLKLQVCPKLTLTKLGWHGKGNAFSLAMEVFPKYLLAYLKRYMKKKKNTSILKLQEHTKLSLRQLE